MVGKDEIMFRSRVDCGKNGKTTRNQTINILQCNIDRGNAAMDLTYKVAEENMVDVVIMAEPTPKRVRHSEWIVDNRTDVAIRICNKDLKILNKGEGDGFVWIETQTIIIFGCYISPNINLTAFTSFLQSLRGEMRKHRKEILVGGDFNSKSYLWGSKVEDKRGELVAEWMAEDDLIVHNQGETPTFIRGNSQSYIDLTFSTRKIAGSVVNWRVIEEESLSCHQHIMFAFRDGRAVDNISPISNKGWRTHINNMAKMTAEVGRILHTRDRRSWSAEGLAWAITKACNKIFPKKGSTARKPVYWWTDKVAEARKSCLQKRRATVRCNKSGDEKKKMICHIEYTQHKSLLKKAILEAKRSAWKKIIDEVDLDVWGKGYQIVTKKLRALPPITMAEEDQADIARTLFPSHSVKEWKRAEVKIEEIPKFTVEEMVQAVEKIKEKKAAGPDGISPEVVKAVVLHSREESLSIVNDLLVTGRFPDTWKMSRLVLIPKEQKQDQQQKSYRPICLLNVLGKFLEQLLLARLKKELEANGGLSDEQYGFREGRSTINALERVKQIAGEALQGPYSSRQICALVTLDVENAFNSAPWEGVLNELRRRGTPGYLYNMIASYFERRTLIIGDQTVMNITCGVPQGSVIGPTLWNVYYDGVFRIPMPLGVQLVGYADDLGVVLTARNAAAIEKAAEDSISSIMKWMEAKQLKLAPQKTEAVLLVGGRKTKSISFGLRGVVIQSQKSLKYLGIHLDRNLTMGVHIRKAAEKAGSALTTLCRLMPNIGGPQENNRRILSTTVQSIILYGASVWGSAMEKQVHRRVYMNIQRKAAIRIIRAYRTTSTRALLVLARTPPIDLLVEMRVAIEKGVSRQDAHGKMMSNWQKRWQNDEGQAAWTRRLIKDLRPWMDRTHGQLNYHLTQLLTGHGSFGSYLRRFALSETDECDYCGKSDTTEHTFFACIRWNPLRMQAEAMLGALTPENIVAKMLRDQNSWDTVERMVKNIITSKESYAKSRQPP